MSANPIKKPVTTRRVVRAMRSRWLIEARTVMAKNGGKLTTGSTMIKRELNAKPAYSVSVRGVIGVGPGRAVRHVGPGARWL